MRGLFGGRRRSVFAHGKDLGVYRNEVFQRTERIDLLLAAAADEIDALRRRDLGPDEAVSRLGAQEELLDEEVDGLQGMMAPEELHGLHMEYEANLERALRGIVTVERGCAITRLPHRPPDDEEPYTYYKRGHANVTHARMRMAEIVDVLIAWEPGRPADGSVAARLERTREG
ncbi:MAG: hypothetical protein M3153_11400 [Chloroflexota bacterium]|nr:hypothetical protein [Chloroflexota bacterium]